MNVYDSMRMADVLHPFGYEPSDQPEGADMVVLNTCHIREKAAEKTYSELGRIRALKEAGKKKGQSMVIVVAGCVGQAEGEAVFKRAPFVDIVVGPQSYHTLPDLLQKIKRDAGHGIDLDFYDNKFDRLPEEKSLQGPAGFLSIQEGCDKFCTFCVVPYTRGAEYSRPVAEIYREALRMVATGSKEITLLGQNVNAYHGEATEGKTFSLGGLLMQLATIKGLERIRYTTSHPCDMHEALYEAHRLLPQLMPCIHLPIQAGSNTVLMAMNRKHTREAYMAIIQRLRQERPDMQFSSDIIVGFPGETEKDFEDTLEIVEKVRYIQCYSFKYSPRPGTPGAERKDQVAEDIKARRLAVLQEKLEAYQYQFNRECIGKTFPVLLEKQGRHAGQIIGKSPYNQSVHVNAGHAHRIGDMVEIRIIGAQAHSLDGEVV